MRRTLTLLALGACLVAAAVLPAVALAHHGHGRDRTISGTVESFNNGMLAIKKASGKVVTAKVTRRTEIECENENDANDTRARASHDGGDDNSGDDRGDDNDNEVERHDQNDDNGVDVENENENENEDQAENCDSSDLTPGTVVSRARLRDRHSTDFWKNLKLAE
jgi:hypothetical protein